MYKLMIVDDELTSLSAISKLIQTQFADTFQIESYYDSMEALENFLKDPVDIVLADIYMPILDGMDLIAQMQSVSKTFVPIVFSGYRDFSYAKQAISLGVIYYLEKPVSPEELHISLTAAIHKLLQNKFPVSSHAETEEKFFMNLVQNPMPSDRLILALRDLHLPFALSHSNGYFLRLLLQDSLGSAPYGYKNLPDTLHNLLYMLLKPTYVCIVQRTMNYCDMIVINPDFSLISVSEIKQQAEILLNLQIQIEVLSKFSSLTELSNSSPLSRQVSGSSPASASDSAETSIQKAIVYMKEHLSENLSCEQVADFVYMSRSHFSRLFKQEMGISFVDYLTDIRIQKAIELLNTDMRIRDIYKAVGFYSQNRFNITFRKATSYTPSEYRKKML